MNYRTGRDASIDILKSTGQRQDSKLFRKYNYPSMTAMRQATVQALHPLPETKASGIFWTVGLVYSRGASSASEVLTHLGGRQMVVKVMEFLEGPVASVFRWELNRPFPPRPVLAAPVGWMASSFFIGTSQGIISNWVSK